MPIRRLDHVNFITHDMPATINFYCNVIGLVQKKGIADKSCFFYIKNQDIPILHVLDVQEPKYHPNFKRFAHLEEDNDGKFSTGSLDHIALLFDENDYDAMLAKLDQLNLSYQTYCYQEMPLKQIWLLDPNGVRIELGFSP